MKKSFLLFLSLFSIFASNISAIKTKNVNAETFVVSDKEYEDSYHLSQMNASKKLLQNYQGTGVKVAVIDSGINIEHEEFFKDNELIISDDSAYVNGGNYYNLEIGYNNDRTRWLNALNDNTGHGTHVASLIAAQANKKGIIGIAPNVELVVIKMGTNSKGEYEYQTICSAIYYAYLIGADVINLSIAGSDTSDYYSDVIRDYDNSFNSQPIIIAAAGNDGVSSTYYPASANNVISIAASSREDYHKPASFTNYGYVDFAAPGYTYGAYTGGSAEYKHWQGTSFASPLVAGLAALYKEQNPEVTRNSFIEALKNSSTKIIETSKFGWTGNGLVDADKLLNISHATSLTLSAPTYPDMILDPNTGELIEQVLDLSDIGWKFELNVEPYPSNTLLPEIRYSYSSNPDVIKIIGNKLEVVGPGVTKIRVESMEDQTVFGEISLTVENRNELESNPICISGSNGNNILNLEADFDDFLSISYDNNQYETWKNAFGIWAHDDNDRFIIEDDYYITDIYNAGGYKIYYQAIDYIHYDSKTGTYPFAIDYKIVNVINGIDLNVESVALDESNLELVKGEQRSLNATILPYDVTNNKVIWSSSNESVASISKNGLITALNSGVTTIRVTTLDGNKTAECIVNVISNAKEEEILIDDINSCLVEFSVARDNPSDLSELKALVEYLRSRYNEIDNKDEIINGEYIAHMEAALNFLENEWYGVIRLRSTNNAKVKRVENDEWSICDIVHDKSKATRVIEVYDKLDKEVKNILDDTCDIVDSNGMVITVGQTIRYIAASLSLESGNIDNNNTFLTLGNHNPIIYLVISIAVITFVVACVIAFSLYKRRRIKEN